jgi:cytochrome c peroxidase
MSNFTTYFWSGGKLMSYYFRFLSLLCLLVPLFAFADNTFKSLKYVPIPGPSQTDIDKFVRDKKAVIQLGKALFWDMRVGSDNKTACASCHFHAGADSRVVNQISPGLLAGDNTFQFAKPNHRLLAEEFPIPFKRYNNVNDVVSSQGVFNTLFTQITTSGIDQCLDETDAVFHGLSDNGMKLNTRKVEPRNSPTVINAVFNFRNFWDGRAVNVYNGMDPFGLRNKDALLWKFKNGKLSRVSVSLPFSSLASQASGPPLSGFEMSCRERIFVDLGKKLSQASILNNQEIHPDDSVLGKLHQSRPQYHTLIRQGFNPEWWQSNIVINVSTSEAARARSMDHGRGRVVGNRRVKERVSLIEANFSLFFGLAIQMYTSTLVSDDSPADRYAEGNTKALTAQQIRGKKVFETKGRCINCHGGAETTNASVSNVVNQRIETMIMGDGFSATYDNGFYNIGVRPTKEDIGVGGTDPFGNPLSETLMVKKGLSHLLGNNFDSNRNPKPGDIKRVAVNGAFKTPSIRNVELTGPYFHNGGKSSLMQVVDFYDRGGDFGKQNENDLDPDIRRLHLSDGEKEDLVTFMLALTDERVKLKKAPFDHPSLCVPDGHQRDEYVLIRDGSSKRALDNLICFVAVGSAGVTRDKALKPFLEVDHFLGDEFKSVNSDE